MEYMPSAQLQVIFIKFVRNEMSAYGMHKLMHFS